MPLLHCFLHHPWLLPRGSSPGPPPPPTTAAPAASCPALAGGGGRLSCESTAESTLRSWLGSEMAWLLMNLFFCSLVGWLQGAWGEEEEEHGGGVRVQGDDGGGVHGHVPPLLWQDGSESGNDFDPTLFTIYLSFPSVS